MKIIIAAEIFPPDIGGPATYSRLIAAELAKSGWEVKLICYSDKKKEIGDDSYPFKIFRIKRSKFKPFHYQRYFFQLKKIANDSDLIYAQGPVASGLPALKVKKITGKKLIVKVVGDYAWEKARNQGKTDLGIDEFQGKIFAGIIGRLQRIEKEVLKNADKIIVPSQYLKKIVSGWGVAEEKIEVIYNAISKILDTKYKIQDTNNGVIASVGRLVSWKGFETLISLMPELLKYNQNLKLKIYGDGPDRGRLEKLISELDLREKVSINKVDHSKLMQQLAKAEIFVLNTGYEGFPHTVLEAMSVGLPVVTTNIGGNPEIITDDYNGLLVEYNNKEQLKQAILKLYSDPALRQKFIQNSKEVLQKFTLENMINKTINVLKSL